MVSFVDLNISGPTSSVEDSNFYNTYSGDMFIVVMCCVGQPTLDKLITEELCTNLPHIFPGQQFSCFEFRNFLSPRLIATLSN